ncbi:MAG TPA: serine hydrolase domain-containing protein [Allosphingosinicella sp.]|jgi:CubicO group peptidase (beta-lactamase class C family)
MKLSKTAAAFAIASLAMPAGAEQAPGQRTPPRTLAPAPPAPPQAPSIAADPKLAARLRAAEAWIETQLAAENVAGASMAIVHDQQVVWSRGFGFANVAGRVPATPQTRYSICSISKLFTSMAAMRERDAGRLDIDRPVSAYLPWYNIRDVQTPDGPVTARAIMSHVAGLPREADTPYWSEARFPDLETVRARLGEQTNLYRAYDHLQYSNLGMALLGNVVETTSGQDYHAYIRSNFLQPLGLTRTTSEIPVRLRGGELAIGYAARRTGWNRDAIPAYTLNALAPAAGFASTAEDLGRFASWQFRLLASGGENVLRSSTLREMQRVHWMTPDNPNETWGLGFGTYQHAGKTFVGHGGYCPGYRTTLMMRPQDKLAIVVLVNTDDGEPGRFARQLYDLTEADIVRAAAALTPATGPAPRPQQPPETAGPAPATDLAPYEGTYRTSRSAGDVYVAPYGNELMVIDLFADTPASDITRLRHVEADRFRVVRSNDTLAEEVRFDRNRQGRVTRIWWHSNYLDRRD